VDNELVVVVVNHNQNTKYLKISNPKYFIGSCLKNKRTLKNKNYIFSNDFHLTLSNAMTLKFSKSEIDLREFEMFLHLRSLLIVSNKVRQGLARLPLKLSLDSALIANNIVDK